VTRFRHAEPVTDVTGVAIRSPLPKFRHTSPKPPQTHTLSKNIKIFFNLHTRFFKIFPCLFKTFSKKFHFFHAKSLTTHQ